MPELQLMLLGDLSRKQVRLLVSNVSQKLAKPSSTALELFRQQSGEQCGISTGLPDLDKALGGKGLSCGSIVEVSGAPGIGKSQFCMTCCASILLRRISFPSEKKFSVIYIDTELKFSAQRLLEIIVARSGVDSGYNTEEIMNRVNVKRISTVKALNDVIDALPTEVIKQDVGLVVIDSIAALARREGQSTVECNALLLRQVVNFL